GYGPVDVSIAASANVSLAPGCTATPAPANSTSATLPVSTNVPITEIWTIHCNETGEKTFQFDNAIAVTTAHVTDPDPGNNMAFNQLTVTVVPSVTETDLVAELIKDEEITVPEDLLYTGDDLDGDTIPDPVVTVRITNGAGPTSVAVQLTQVSLDRFTCVSHLVPEAGDTLQEWTVGNQYYSKLTWTEPLMAAFEVRDVSRDYEILCSEAGFFPNIEQFVVDIDPLDMDELNPVDNTAENHVSVHDDTDI
ncbi:unnamed protein product, partial [marine sediment metagenome]